jgi:hypothetical protein
LGREEKKDPVSGRACERDCVTNPHTQIYNLKFHPIINNNNNGTHQVGKTGLVSTNILGFKDGEEGITKETLKLHLSLLLTIIILSFH